MTDASIGKRQSWLLVLSLAVCRNAGGQTATSTPPASAPPFKQLTGDIQAWTAASDVGFTFEHAPFKPRLGLKANITSGDDNPNNADLQTFNPLFPRGAYFGEPALIGPANHIDVHPQLDLALRRNVTLTLDWDCFWRENMHDIGSNGQRAPTLRTCAVTDLYRQRDRCTPPKVSPPAPDVR